MNLKFNVLGVIQARMSSRRFPGKVLQPIQGTPMLEFLIRRIQKASCLDKLIVATSTNPVDDAIVKHVQAFGVEVVRGSENDVLSRYLHVIEKFPAHSVVRITADNPLTDPELLELVVSVFLSEHLDYAYMKAVPLGTASDVFRAETLHFIAQHSSHTVHREHINAYILEYPDQFRWKFLDTIPEAYRRPDLSFTIDTPAEFKWVQMVLEQMKNTDDLRLRDIIMTADALRAY